MVTLKEYEIYLKVKKFIETEGCDEADLIPRLVKWNRNYSYLRSTNHKLR